MKNARHETFVFFIYTPLVFDDLAHHHLLHNWEGFVQEHKKCYSVRIERGSFCSHNLTSHRKQAPFKRERPSLEVQTLEANFVFGKQNEFKKIR